MHILSLVCALIFSWIAPVAAAPDMGGHGQDFVITAYYSPLPDQCCYIKGSLDADKILNGNGTHGADGTPVAPGMAAAPATYAFGTRIALPGIGVVTVHDRGGAIIEQEHAHRLDLWMGSGEEGLARALAFGVKRVHGTVYLPDEKQPEEHLVLERFASPFDRLQPYAVSDGTSPLTFGARGLSVLAMQDLLSALGYFSHPSTGFFGDVTKLAVLAFARDAGLPDADPAAVTPELLARLEAAAQLAGRSAPVAPVGPESAESDIAKARRILRALGYYKGRTLGAYDEPTRTAIIAFQRDQKLIGHEGSPGAGRIGPMTIARITVLWRSKLAAARAGTMLLRKEVAKRLTEKGLVFAGFLDKGDKGDTVRTLQKMLVARGLLAPDSVTGTFGDKTRAALLDYQLERGIVKTGKDTGAGTVGPATLQALRDEQIDAWTKKVRADGLGVL
jgi:peptidoglycan hydrolase-like protein with peptidoglycan-binding domain/3D (Asp-Asp-Asp) domain-containing protein